MLARIASPMPLRAIRRFSGAAARPAKKEKPYVPVDRSAISPIRGLFLGDLTSFQKNCVPFPNSLNQEQTDTLRAMVDPVRDFFSTVPSTQIDETHLIPPEVLSGLRELGLYGLQIPEAYGGLALPNSAYARMVEEIATDASIAVHLMGHQSIGLKGILLFGTEEQKQKYLPKLASGEHVAAFVLTEPTVGSDAAGVKLSCTPTPDGKGYVLNGQKMWITNGGFAQVMTVFAKGPDGKMTAFIVERAFGGIVSGPPEKKLGIHGSNTCVLTFDNTFVPIENVLGEAGAGFKVAMSILNSGRFGLGAGSAGGIRKLIQMAGDYANARVQFGQPIANFGLIKEKFARMALDAYAVESMAYCTTALTDKGMDCGIEAAACKIYGSESIYKAVNECIQILGGVGFSTAFPFERMVRDTKILTIFEGTGEILRLLIGLTGIRSAGSELTHASANPLSNLGGLAELMKRVHLPASWSAVAPTGIASELQSEAQDLAVATVEFQKGIYHLLRRYGKDIVLPDNQLAVKRAADSAIDLFAWQCVLSRATAAKEDNVEHLQHEFKIVKAWVREAKARISENVRGMIASPTANGDKLLMDIARESLEAGKHLATHPLRV